MTELVKKEVDDAINFMFDVVSKRHSETGIAWWSQEEGGQLCKKFGMPLQGALRYVYSKVKEAVGEDFELFHDIDTGQIIVELMRLGKAKGVIDEEVMSEARKKYNRTEGHGMGPMVKAARKRLGFVDNGHDKEKPAEKPPAAPGYISDVTILLAQYQKLVQKRQDAVSRKHEIDIEIEAIDKEMEKYKPLARVMEAARETVKSIKENGA